jgi:hypothetical protein
MLDSGRCLATAVYVLTLGQEYIGLFCNLFYDVISISYYTAENGMVIDERGRVVDLEGSGRDLVDVLSWDMPVRTE